MTRRDLQRLSLIRQREARALLESNIAHGAYYLVGYAVECALKARIARQTRRFEFPDKKRVQQAHTHDRAKLIEVADLSTELNAEIAANRAFAVNWMLVKDWSEESRYNSQIAVSRARDLYIACTAPRRGFLPWIRRRW